MGEVVKNSFIALSGKEPQQAGALKTVCPPLEGIVRSLIAMVLEGMVSFMYIFWWLVKS